MSTCPDSASSDDDITVRVSDRSSSSTPSLLIGRGECPLEREINCASSDVIMTS